MENEVVNDKEKALKELESLRGKVSEIYLDHIIEEVKMNFDSGFGSPAVYVDIQNYSEGRIQCIITIALSFQGSVNVTRFVKIDGENETVNQCHLMPELVEWMYNAKQRYNEREI